MLEAVRGQEAQQLELDALAGREPPVDLEDGALAEHDRAVGLLAADQSRGLERGAGGSAAASSNSTRPSPVASPAEARSASSSAARQRRVRERELHAAVLLAVGELVERVPAVGELDLEQGQRAAVRERALVHDAPARRAGATWSRTSAARARAASARARRGSRLHAQQVGLLQARLEADVVAALRAR